MHGTFGRLKAACWITASLAGLLAVASAARVAAQPADQPAEKSAKSTGGVDEAAYALPELKFVDDDKPYVVDANQLSSGVAKWIKEVSKVAAKPPIHPDQPQFVAELNVAAPLLPRDGQWILQDQLDEMLRTIAQKHRFEDWIVDFFRHAGFRAVRPGTEGDKYDGTLRLVENPSKPAPVRPSFPWSNREFGRFDTSYAQREGRVLYGRVFYRSNDVVYLLATSKDGAKELAKAFIVLVNQGKALPCRIQSLVWKQAADAELAETQKKLTSAQQDLGEREKALKALADVPVVSNDTLNELKTKKVLLSVERAGISARIAAAEKLLAGPHPPDDRTKNLVALKEAAEIELAGLAGQVTEIDRLIDNSAKRIAVQRDRDYAAQKVERAQGVVKRAELVVAAQEENIQATAPVELLDKAIVIRPVRLTAESAK